jgi:hypothetical protein
MHACKGCLFFDLIKLSKREPFISRLLDVFNYIENSLDFDSDCLGQISRVLLLQTCVKFTQDELANALHKRQVLNILQAFDENNL